MTRTSTYDETQWKLVPIEPTERQLSYAHERMYDMRKEKWFDAMTEVYAALLTTAPPYPHQSGEITDMVSGVNCKGFLDSWISCDDQLPEMNVPVLTCVNGDTIRGHCRIDLGDDGWGWGVPAYSGELSDPRGYECDDDYIVDFWMPLPLPPRVG